MAYLIHVNSGVPIQLEPHNLIGRRGEGVQIALPAPESSKLHSVIEWQNGQWALTDFSRNGTWLDAQKLHVNQPGLGVGKLIPECFRDSPAQQGQ